MKDPSGDAGRVSSERGGLDGEPFGQLNMGRRKKHCIGQTGAVPIKVWCTDSSNVGSAFASGLLD